MDRKRNPRTGVVMVVFGVVVVCVLCSGAFGQPWDGGGVEGDPYQIWTAADMQAIGSSSYLGAHFVLMADIDLGGYTGTSYNRIGTGSVPFTGVFDGNGHTISNFTYTSTDASHVGIFGYFAGEIKNLGLINPNVDAGTGSVVGSLVGQNEEATITNCYVDGGSVSGDYYVGGLVGQNGRANPDIGGTITKSYSTASVSGTSSVGGLVGYNVGTITECYSTGTITTEYWPVGGLVGCNVRGTITNCYSSASVSGDEQVGGLVGDNDYGGTITGCHSTGQVQGQSNSAGLAGVNSGSITNCYSTASVSGAGRVGGLVGTNDYYGAITNCYSTGQIQGGSKAGGLVGTGGTITNCYSTASVSGTTNVGGLVGQGGNITNCYSTGSVSGTTDVGGLVGSGATVYSSFWDIQTSGQTTSAGGTGLTTAEMQDMNTFLGAGWDFVGEYENGPNDDWAQGSGGGYMILWWQVPENEIPPLPTFSGGAGTESDPYLISNATDLNRIGHNGRLMDKHFKLIDDIDLMGIDIFVIGSPWYDYSGIFDGNGHTISNFTYTSAGTDYIGLFRCVRGADAEVKNLGLINPSVEGGDYDDSFGSLVGYFVDGTVSGCYVEGGSVSGTGSGIGGLVGENYGTITECYSTASVSGGGEVGGLVGNNGYGIITDCHSSGSVTGTEYYVGGLVGYSSGTLANCYSTANVTGNINVGGLVGYASGTMTNCYSAGSVSGGEWVGGLVGWSRVTISNCYSTASVSGAGRVGGLVGVNGGTIYNCYSEGDVSGGEYVGGLVGENKGSTIRDCYSTGSVSGTTGGSIGGLVGINYTIGSVIMNCYSTASVSSGGGPVGGLVGDNEGMVYYCYSAGSVSGGGSVGGLVGTGGLVFFSFWDRETSGQAASAGGIGLPTAQMQMESTFTAVGWDFVYTWDILEGTNYPQLAWEVVLSAGIDMDEFWMYQGLPGQSNSDLTAGVSVTDDPMGNSSYSYAWEIVLAWDVSLAPVTVDGGGGGDAYWTFAARGCDEPGGLSDSGQTFTVRVTVTGDDYGNTGQAEAEFGIALLGDTNNDGVVNVADRSIANAFWRTGSAGPYTLRDCDVNCDGVVNVADRSIANAIWRGILGQNSVSSPCPLR